MFYTFTNVKANRWSHLIWARALLHEKGVWLAGGAARSVFTQEPVRDYDFFFQNGEVARHADNYFQKNLKAKILFDCPAGKLTTYQVGPYRVQTVKERWYTNLLDLLESFDFTVTMFGVPFPGTLISHEWAIRDTRKKELRLYDLTYPVSSLKRAIKYSNRGYNPNPAIKEIVQELTFRWQDLHDDELRVYVD